MSFVERLALYLIAGITLAGTSHARAAQPRTDPYTYTQIVYPKAHVTLPTGLNDSGEVVGFYQVGKNGPYHGFSFAAGGFATIDPPGSSGTVVTGIANDGTIVGYYQLGTLNEIDGFILKDGQFTFFGELNSYTYLTAISRSGIAIGKTSTSLSEFHTWFSVQNGAVHTRTFGPDLVNFVAVNDSGMATGIYQNIEPFVRGAYLYANGGFSPLPISGKAYATPYAINNEGIVVGDTDSDGSGFMSDGRTVTRVRYPSASVTDLEAINDAGLIAGTAILPRYPEALFTLSHGQFTTLSPPGLKTAGALQAINAAGQVIGDVLTDPLTQSFNGFLATPN